MESLTLKLYGIFLFVFAFLLGVWFASFELLSIPSAVFLLFLGAVLGLYSFFFVRETHVRELFFALVIVLLSISLGIARYDTHKLPVDRMLEGSVGSKVEVVGKVVEEPKIGSTYRGYVIELDSGVKVLARVNPFPAYEFGDTLSVWGKLELPEPFLTPEGKLFDYPSYLRKEGISYVMSFSSADRVAESSFSIQGVLFRIKHKFVSSFEKSIPFPQSGLLAGILLGVDDALPKDLLNTFRLVGIIHIVVLSGYNITIVAESVRELLGFLSRKKALIFSAGGIILFSIMVGLTPSVVRALIMALLALVARATHRRYDVARALALAAFAMVLWNPMYLVFDIGFQLSFLATIALIWISPWFLQRLTRVPEKFGLREVVSTTVAVQLFVLPYLAYQSGIISLISFVVNVLILPIVPLVMVMGFVTGTLGLVSSALAFVPGAITYATLFYIIWVSEVFSRLPHAVVATGHLSVLVPACFYAGFCIFALWYTKSTRITPSASSTSK